MRRLAREGARRRDAEIESLSTNCHLIGIAPPA